MNLFIEIYSSLSRDGSPNVYYFFLFPRKIWKCLHLIYLKKRKEKKKKTIYLLGTKIDWVVEWGNPNREILVA